MRLLSCKRIFRSSYVNLDFPSIPSGGIPLLRSWLRLWEKHSFFVAVDYWILRSFDYADVPLISAQLRQSDHLLLHSTAIWNIVLWWDMWILHEYSVHCTRSHGNSFFHRCCH
ncbi:hypothetical protein PRIPAC_81885 [Pristionchus pacificus]|nr:hypothetical protein PRIPAC_81885 [Pristionchus pacificus]